MALMIHIKYKDPMPLEIKMSKTYTTNFTQDQITTTKLTRTRLEEQRKGYNRHCGLGYLELKVAWTESTDTSCLAQHYSFKCFIMIKSILI